MTPRKTSPQGRAAPPILPAPCFAKTLIVVNNRKFADFSTYWHKAAERLMRCSQISTPVSLIVHSVREVNAELKRGRYFFVDIRRDGLALYELDDDPLATPGLVSPEEAWQIASGYLADRLAHAHKFLKGARFYQADGDAKEGAFMLHQAIEQAYSTLLLVLTNYSPPSHNIRFLRGLAETQNRGLIEVWPRDNHRHISWFNMLNEAYVKARYSPHFTIPEDALQWLIQRVAALIFTIEKICVDHLDRTRPS